MPDKSKILIVDDERHYINVLVGLLGKDYRTVVAKDGDQALQRVQEGSLPDLILLDVLMPGINGYEVCERLKCEARTRDIPVIFMTVKDTEMDEVHGFELGAVDYITKPMSPPVVMARVSTHIALQRARKALHDHNRALEEKVSLRTKELERTQDVAILCMASLAETRDSETGRHIMRTQRYVKVLAEHLRNHIRFRAEIDDEFIELLFKSAPLHDIGKVGVPDRILMKPGPLNDEERIEMRRHAEYGRAAILRAESELGTTSFLRVAREISYTHHEKWDGSGYPEGLAGDDIPISGRLMALADVYDALISRRIYKEPIPHLDSVSMINQLQGRQFDPDVCTAFNQILPKFVQIAQSYPDTP